MHSSFHPVNAGVVYGLVRLPIPLFPNINNLLSTATPPIVFFMQTFSPERLLPIFNYTVIAGMCTYLSKDLEEQKPCLVSCLQISIMVIVQQIGWIPYSS